MEEVIVSSVVNELAAKPSISDNGQVSKICMVKLHQYMTLLT